MENSLAKAGFRNRKHIQIPKQDHAVCACGVIQVALLVGADLPLVARTPAQFQNCFQSNFVQFLVAVYFKCISSLAGVLASLHLARPQGIATDGSPLSCSVPIHQSLSDASKKSETNAGCPESVDVKIPLHAVQYLKSISWVGNACICLSCLHNPSQVHAKELKLDLMGMAPSSRTWWMMSNRELLGSNFIKHHNTNISKPCSTSITLQILDQLVQHRLFPKKILIEMQENTCIFIHSWGIPDLSHSFILSASPPAIV